MATISVPESMYARLKVWAAVHNQTVEEAVTPVLDRLAPEVPADDGDWLKAFDELTELHRSRTDRYPPGFRVDDGRESIYEGCGE